MPPLTMNCTVLFSALLPIIILFAHHTITIDAWTTTSQLPTFSQQQGGRRAVISTSGLKDPSSEPFQENDDNTEERIGHEQSRRRWLNSVAYSVAILPASATKAIAAPSLVKSKATCDSSVSIWKRGDRIVYLLGTAHISSVSANLAGQLVKDIHPNAVFIELDLKRVGSLSSLAPSGGGGGGGGGAAGDDTAETNRKSHLLVPAISSTSTSVSSATAAAGDSPLLVEDATSSLTTTTQQKPRRGGFGADPVGFGANMLGNALRGMYKNLDQAGFKPGEEFLLAVKEGQSIGADIVLGDRDVEVTLRRLTQALAVTDVKKLMSPDNELEQSLRELLPSEGDPSMATNDPAAMKEELSTFVESIKTRDSVRKIMGQLKEMAPALVQVMLEERDAYMAGGLDTLNQYTVIVAVMGIAHMDGVEANLRYLGWKPVRPRC